MFTTLILAAATATLTPQQDAWGELMFNVALCRDYIEPAKESELLTKVASIEGDTSTILIAAYAYGISQRHRKFDAVYCDSALKDLLNSAVLSSPEK